MVKFKTHNRSVFSIPGYITFVLIAFLVFSLSLAFTIFAWQKDLQLYNKEQQIAFSNDIDHFENFIDYKLSLDETILSSGASLISDNQDLTQDQWKSFLMNIQSRERYKGMLAAGYLDLVQENNTFTTPVKFIATLSLDEEVNDLIGFDMSSDPSRTDYISKTIKTGSTVMNPGVRLKHDTSGDNKGFIIYYPVFQTNETPSITGSEDQIIGLTFGVFRFSDFYQQVAQNNKNLAFEVRLSDGSEILYKSANYAEGSKDAIDSVIDVFGTSVTFSFVTKNYYQGLGFRNRPTNILISGIFFSIAITIFVYLLITSKALLIVKKEEGEAQRAKDELLSLASHQLRTPATAVKQYIGMLLEGYLGRLSPVQEDAVRKAYLSNDRQLETINQILYVSKADAGQLKLQKSTFNINKLIETAISDLKEVTDKRRHKVIFNKTVDPLLVYADANCIRMIIENLINNASKYTYKRGRIVITSGLKKDKLFFQVADNGVGIRVKDFSKLFKKFSRIDNELSIEAGGSGIGLYLDKLLVELHGGYLEVESELKKGSVFKVYLPKQTNDKKKGTVTKPLRYKVISKKAYIR